MAHVHGPVVDPVTHGLLVLGAVIGGVLAAGSVAGVVLRRTTRSDRGRTTAANLNARVAAWWGMAVVFGLAVWAGRGPTCGLFGAVAFLALREMLTLTPTRRGDHHGLFWAFFVVVPLQFYVVYIGWYGLFSVFVPVYAFLFLAVRGTLTGDTTGYLGRTAKIQWAVMLCVYFVSHAPALLTLDVPGYTPAAGRWAGDDPRLLVWMVVVVQLSDVAQYVWGKLLGRRPIAPHVSPNKTWAGFVGGVLSAGVIGAALARVTPFTVAQAGGIALLLAVLGFLGGIVTSAVKRDAGVKDYGNLLPGHGGMMDRVDSLTFAAPVLFHLVRYGFTAPGAYWLR